jgi:hypothetical protein
MKERYTLIIDGNKIATSNNIKYLKKQAAIDFEFCNACYAEIKRGSKVYADKRWDADWHRVG